jgi:hypothetical protein
VVHAAETLPRVIARVERRVPDAVLEWRFDELERAGVDALDAFRFCLDPSFDVARVRSLVARGCSAALAVRILC